MLSQKLAMLKTLPYNVLTLEYPITRVCTVLLQLVAEAGLSNSTRTELPSALVWAVDHPLEYSRNPTPDYFEQCVMPNCGWQTLTDISCTQFSLSARKRSPTKALSTTRALLGCTYLPSP